MGRRKTEKEYIGKIYENKYGTLFKIVSYTNYQNVDCLDITHNIILKATPHKVHKLEIKHD